MFYVIYYVLPDNETIRVETCREELKKISVLVFYIMFFVVQVLIFMFILCHIITYLLLYILMF